MKQRNAFPPNFIHSLDSSHMMLTALHCQREGITFASIHDCFWTHPCTVNQMNKVTKRHNCQLAILRILTCVIYCRFVDSNSSLFTLSPFWKTCPSLWSRNSPAEQGNTIHSQCGRCGNNLFLSFSDGPEDETPKGLARHRLNQILSEVPRRGVFDLRLVLDSVYFFS